MARDQIVSSKATLHDLEQPEKLSKVLAKDNVDDCISCRLTGAAAFTGLGAYSYYTGHQQLIQRRKEILKSGSIFGLRSRRAGITGISLMLVGLGAWRLVN